MTNVTSIQNIQKPQYMNADMLREFSDRLTKMRSEATDSLNMKPIELENQRLPDDCDVAKLQEAATIQMIGRGRDVALVNAITQSLSQIAGGEYGYCGGCGDEIGVDRLRAQPTACLCIACKEAEEKMSSQFLGLRAA